MANITIQIPDAMMPRVEEAFTKQMMYQEQIPDPNDLTKTIPNPETKPQFVKSKIRDYIKSVVGNYEGMAANTAAAKKAMDDLG